MVNLQELMEQKKSYSPTLADLNTYFDDIGFVGDTDTRLTLSMGVLRRKAIGVVSGAGTGKSAVVDAVLGMFKDHQIYTMGSGSNTAQAYSHEQINKADLIYITELQKMATGDVAIEMLKDLGEGKDYNRKVVKQGGNAMETQVIKKGKAIIYTKAIENDFKTDDELQRRYPNLTTDMTAEQNLRVIKSKAGRRSKPFAPTQLTTLQKVTLESQMSKLLKMDANKYVFINPAADLLAESIPHTFAISRSYADHYFDLIEGVAFFNSDNRMIETMRHGGQDRKVIFVTPEDCWQLHKIYSRQFLQDVMNLPPNGIKVIEAFHYAKETGVKSEVKSSGFFTETKEEDKRVKMTLRQIFNTLKSMGIVLKENVIKKIIESLKESGYINEDISATGNKTNPEYYLNDEVMDFDNFIDWDAVVKECARVMQESYPEYADEYIRRFCDNPKVVDPVDGHTLTLNSFTNEPKKKKSAEVEVEADMRDDWMSDDNE